jgi:hypothetical protein
MDYQILFNGAVAIAAFFGGWTLNSITKAIERLDTDVRAMPHDYVSKTDYKDELREVKDMLGKIFDKLDGKADK